MTNIYTNDEVARHNNENDLWMVIHGSVYDLSKFAKEHPGGAEVLIDLAGRDGTVCFDDIGHTTEAILLRETFKIGEILNGDNGIASSSVSSQAKKEESAPYDDDWEYEEIKQEKPKELPLIIAAGILIYAVIFYYFWY